MEGSNTDRTSVRLDAIHLEKLDEIKEIRGLPNISQAIRYSIDICHSDVKGVEKNTITIPEGYSCIVVENKYMDGPVRDLVLEVLTSVEEEEAAPGES